MSGGESATDQEQPTTLLDSLIELRDCLGNEEDFVSPTTALCESLLASNEEIPKDVQSMLQDILIKCAMEMEDYTQVLKFCETYKDPAYDSLAAYALYRLNRYQEAHAKSKNNDDLFGQHIQAQTLFRLWNTNDALDQYIGILSNDDDVETLTNALAAAHGNTLPFTGLKESHSLVVERATRTIQEQQDEYPYDLAYNLATLQLLYGTSTASIQSAISLLKHAQKACQEALEEEGGYTTTEIQKELIPIVTNLALAQQLLEQRQGGGDGGDSTTTDKSSSASSSIMKDLVVWNVHDAVTTSDSNSKKKKNTTATTTKDISAAQKRLLKKDPSPPTNWTLLQKCMFYDSVALVALSAGQHANCRYALKQIGSLLKLNSASSKSNTPQQWWWQSRIHVMEAYCLVREKKEDQAMTLLQTAIKTLEKTSANDETAQYALAYMKLHSNVLEVEEKNMSNVNDCIELLEGLPTMIRQKRAVIATLASLYNESGGQDTSSTTVLDEASNADLCMAQGNYAKAAELYDILLSNGNDSTKEMMWKAQHVQALTYVDVEQAQTLWEVIKMENNNDEEEDSDFPDVELLEEAELPRLKIKSRASTTTTSTSTTDGSASTSTASGSQKKSSSQKKSHESILRRRAKRRQVYLESKGIPESQKPDPERWIPKHERYGRRRGRGRGGGGGPVKAHQGGGSQKDAAKLDAAARAQAKAAGIEDPSGSRSTAHMSVAGGPKRGGGGGKRR